MRIAAVIMFVVALAMSAAAQDVRKNGSKPATVEELFNQFGLFGTWAADCKQPASPANPHVSVIMPSPGQVTENHDLGPDYAINHYSVLSAERLSATRLAVEVIFQPGGEGGERQKLVFLIRGGTRRTLFNQADGGAVRVKGGIALARGTKTPLLRKCG
jgi:hypothetical protein